LHGPFPIRSRFLFLMQFSFLLVMSSSVVPLNLAAQDVDLPRVEGYITAVHPPTGFEVNGTQVKTGPATYVEPYGGKGSKNTPLPAGALRVGVRVRVFGTVSAKIVNASSVLFFDDASKRLEGFGVIEKVLASGPEPEFQADGYRIRIDAQSAAVFSGELKSLADVGPNTWVEYEGRRDAEGVLVASKATFVAARKGKVRPPPKQDALPSEGGLIDADGNILPLHAKVRMGDAGGVCGWHKIPPDAALQQRVQRVGMRLVPAFQRAMPDDSPSKIDYRFYAIDEPKIRAGVSCNPSNPGLILVPRQVVERLATDDLLAAILAEGVAFGLQQQSAKLITEYRAILGAGLAAEIGLLTVPGGFLAVDFGTSIAVNRIELRMQEQRGRMALAMMADAGYDPWQAPEAWRLLGPKRLPASGDTLKYPDRSGYQLGILGQQYSKPRTAALRTDGAAQ
jgi:hypothetical protein